MKGLRRIGDVSKLAAFPLIDSFPAATAEAHDLTLVTRNVKDVERGGVRCMNPFESRKSSA
jgi:toxin FitB